VANTLLGVTTSQWIFLGSGLLMLTTASVGLAIARPGGRAATERPRAARAFRHTMVGVLLVGTSAVSAAIRHTAPDGGGTWWPIGEAVLQILGCLVAVVGLAGTYRASRRTEDSTGTR
jgi:O-antigen/teichoic acid export membrane protein